MRVLVTGGAGYIGSHTVEALIDQGHHPVIIDNLVYGKKNGVDEILKVPLIVGRVGDKQLLIEVLSGRHINLKGTVHENKHIEAVIHFAGYIDVGESVKKPIKYYKNNVLESTSLLEILSNPKEFLNTKDKTLNPIPIVFSSTCATYGIPKLIPIKEDHPQNPINPYGHSKLFIEQLLKDLALSNGLRSVILRYFNAAGASPKSLLGEEHSPETHLIPLVIEAAMGIRENIRVFGNDYPTPDGTCIRDYIHVNDLADAHIKALNYLNKNKMISNNLENNCNVFNLGNGKGISVNEIINTVEKVTNMKVNVVKDVRREGDPERLIACAEKAKNELGWIPKYTDIDIIVRHAFEYKRNSLLK